MLLAYDHARLACVDAEGLGGWLQRLGWLCGASVSLVDGTSAVPSVRRVVRVPEGVAQRAHDAVPGLVLSYQEDEELKVSDVFCNGYRNL